MTAEGTLDMESVSGGSKDREGFKTSAAALPGILPGKEQRMKSNREKITDKKYRFFRDIGNPFSEKTHLICMREKGKICKMACR